MKQISVLLLCLWLSACGSETETSNLSIHGAWLLKNLQDFGYSTTHIAYLDNGKKCEISATYSFKGDNNTHYHLSSWQLDGDMLTTILDNTTSERTVGTKTTHVIHKLDNTALNILLEQSAEIQFTNLEEHLRLADQDPSAICLVVEGALRKQQLVNILEQNRL